MGVKPIPEGFHTVTPHLVVDGAAKALDFYKQAFGAEEICRMPMPDGSKLMHAEMRIGDSPVMLADEFPDWKCFGPSTLGGSSVTIHVYVNDVDKAFDRAVKAGATPEMPPADMFWGDRYCKVADPFGHKWSLATHIEDPTPEQMAERAASAFDCGP